MDRQQKILAGAVAAALVVGLGLGFLIGKGAGGRRAGPSADVARVETGILWPFFGHPRAADAPRAGLAKPAGFVVWKTRVDTSRAQPVACIELTRALDPRKAYGDFVLVSPSAGGAPAVSARGDELCIGGLGFSDHHVTLLKGLPAASGETLTDNQEVDFTFGDKPPYVGFAGDGVILPREESDGVGIETINVSKLAVEVWRVPDRNLVRLQIAKTDPSGEGEYPSDYGSRPDDEGQVVWKGTLQVKGDPAQKITTVFPLGAVLKELKPGGYVVKARDASGGRDAKGQEDGGQQPAQAMRWVMFTDMALTAYQGSDGLDAVVRSLKTARTLPGVRVALVAKNGEDLATGTTDGSGRVRFPHPLLTGEGASQAKMLMAYGAQADLAVLDLDRSPVDLSALGTGGRAGAPSPVAGRQARTAVDGYLYADRGIYRPGEVVHLVAMVRDQRGQVVKDRKGTLVVKRPSGVDFARYGFSGADTGVVARDIAIPRDAPRGRWTASLQIEGVDDPAGQFSFSVEDFAPQRLAVAAAGQEQTPVLAGQVRKVEVSARFLYGAPGSALQTQGEARIKADDNPFPAFKDFQWGDALKPYQEKAVDLASTVTDAEGRAVLSVDSAQAGDADSPLVADVAASVFEPGGRPVREGLQLKLHTRPLYLGVKVDQGESHNDEAAVSLQLIAVDAFGRRIAAPGTQWSLVAENWDYDWFQTDGRWQWRRTSRDRVIAKGAVDIPAAAAARLNRSLGWGDYRLELTGPQGARTVVRFSAGWGAPAKDTEAPDVVRVSAGTKHYAQGDSVEVAIKAPYAGEAQVAVATDQVIDFRTLSVGKDGVANLSLKSSDLWGGGAYVLVTVIQPRDPVATPRPRRALGLVYVPLDPKGRRLTVDVGTPDKITSRTGIEIPIAVQGLHLGQRARVTVAAVDEGILRLTKQESPDPVKWYFGKRALSVDYRDDYGRLLDPNLGAPANVNFGGDEIGGEGLTTTPIKTVALWSGIVETGLDGRARVKLPAQADFNGQLRVMAVAWTDEAVGSGAKDMLVREPVIAELSLPRFLAPGDRAFATLELHNLEGAVGQYVAQITSSGGVLAPFRKLYDLMLGQHVIERAPIAAPNAAGISRISFSVSGPGFGQTKTYPIETRLGWGPVTRTFTELQKPGEAFTPPPQLMAGLAAGSVTMEVSYSPFRGFDPGPIAVALNRYPYGCTEQIVSTAYPLLYAAEASNDPRARQAMAALAGAVSRLLDRQSLDGAFGLWRVGDGEADPWLGAYVTDFLIEAQKRGVAVPQDAIDRSLSAMRQVSRPDGEAASAYRLTYPDWWAGSKEASKAATQRMRSRASAYALYVLAKAGRGDLARLRWWHDVQMKAEPSPLARAQVAAGLELMGDRARAHDGFEQALQAVGYKRPALQIGPVVWVDSDDWYQSPLRDLAGVVALAYEAGETGVGRQLQGRLEGAVKDPDALNTQEEAQLLRAAHFMLAAAGRIRIDASGVIGLPSSGGAPRWAVGRLASARFVNSGTGALWRTVTVRGTPLASPPAEGHSLGVSTSFYGFTGGSADPASMRQGERLIVRISGHNDQARALPLVIDDALPAGWEIEMTLSPDDAQKGPFKFLGELSGTNAQEARDDRYVAALDVPGGKSFAVAYVARAVTPGDFYLPGAEAHDMYKPAVFARTAGRRAHIAPGG